MNIIRELQCICAKIINTTTEQNYRTTMYRRILIKQKYCATLLNKRTEQHYITAMYLRNITKQLY